MSKRLLRIAVVCFCICILALLVILWTTFAVEEVQTQGIASWYGGGEKLNEFTASGEIFDPTQLTAASWGYPFGTKLKVTNLKTGKAVIVRVNDRGPARRLNRIIDLSREAFHRIAPLEKGLVKVRVKEEL